MANSIQIYRSQVTATPPALTYGSLAYSELSGTLFIGNHLNAPIAVAGALYATLASPTFTGTPAGPTAAVNTNTTQLATTAFVIGQGYLTGNQSITLTGKVSGTGTTSIATTVNLLSSDIPQTLTHLWVTDFQATVNATALSLLAVPTSAVSWNSQALQNLAAPVNANDAATKAYVDASAQGLDVKAAAVCASTANLTLSGLQAIDGYTTLANDRVLVKNQSTASGNGIYAASSGAWARTADFNSSSNVLPGSFCFVEQGTVGAGTSWVLTGGPTFTVGTTALNFAQFGGAGTYSAGNGLNLAGGQFTVVGTTNQITVGAGGVSISATYAGQTSIVTLGNLTTVGIDLGTF